MIEQDIEASIISAIEALELTGLDVRGSWQAATDGDVKDVESASSPAAVFVQVSPRSFADYSSPEATFPVILSFVLRADKDPTGAALASYCGPVVELLQGWNLDIAAGSDICALDVTSFNTHFVQFSGGDGPTFDRDAGAWSVTFNITVGGVVVSV